VSTLRVSNLQNNTGSGTISVPTGNKIRGVDGASIYSAGQVVQVIYARTDNRTTFSSANSGNGTTVTDLNLTITPKFSTSLLVMQWMINGELHQDNTFLIHRNGSLITDTSYTGYNSSVGNIRSSGYASAFYDQNEDSTPSNWFIQYSIPASSTTAVTFAPAVRGSGASAYTFALNRTISGSTGDNYESMVSSGMIMEVAQ
jgi:hypothetical protein